MDAFAALADPVRRSLLAALTSGPARVVDLAQAQAVSRPAVSRHLRLLTEAGLVSGVTRGRERHYRLVPDGTDPVRRFVRSIDPSRAPVTERALDALTTEVHRTRREVRRAARRETA